MTEEIKIRQTAEEATVAFLPANRPAQAARAMALRERKEPMVSWAALLRRSREKPGFIHEAYSRFHRLDRESTFGLVPVLCMLRGICHGIRRESTRRHNEGRRSVAGGT